MTCFEPATPSWGSTEDNLLVVKGLSARTFCDTIARSCFVQLSRRKRQGPVLKLVRNSRPMMLEPISQQQLKRPLVDFTQRTLHSRASTDVGLSVAGFMRPAIRLRQHLARNPKKEHHCVCGPEFARTAPRKSGQWPSSRRAQTSRSGLQQKSRKTVDPSRSSLNC